MVDNYNGVSYVWVDEYEHHFPTSNSPANVQPKRIRLSPESSDSQEGRSSSSQSSLLGLSLRKTPSFVNLVERTLSKEKKVAHVAGAEEDDLDHLVERALNLSKAEADDVAVKSKCPKKPDEKMKASNFPAFFIQIGKWQRVTRYEGDLTVKVYYAKKKLVWEILDGALKNKIEIQWADISAIRAHTPENEPGTLHIELERPPLFFREQDPEPRKHTIWRQGSDFTGGQAHIWRRHCVKFPPKVLDKHFENLLQSDPRLLALTRAPFPSHSSPFFDTPIYGVSQLSLLLNNFESGSSNPPPPISQALLMPGVDTNNALVGVMQQQFEFDQQAVVNDLTTNPTTYYDGGNPNFFEQYELAVAPIHSLLPPPPPQQESAHDHFFPQHTDYELFLPQQEAPHDFCPDYQLFPPPPQPHHDFFTQHVNYSDPPPLQQDPLQDFVSYLHLPPHQYLTDDDVGLFMQQQRWNTNNSCFSDNINPGSGPFF